MNKNYKPPVLCISRDLLPVPHRGFGIHSLDLNSVPDSAFHFINRDVVDSSHPHLLELARHLPQILAYVFIKCGNRVLTYSRKKGAEARLHGSRSIGFGGHVDIGDYSDTIPAPFIEALKKSTVRELAEELNYQLSVQQVSNLNFTSILLDTTNPVGCVHLGIPLVITIDDESTVTPDPDEIADAKWQSISELKQDIHLYENWSQLLIKAL